MSSSVNSALSSLRSGPFCGGRLLLSDQKGQLLARKDAPTAGRLINHEVILWTDGKR